jgi:TolB-like protein
MLPLLGLAAVLATAGVVWSTVFWRPAALPPRLSLIVLPFSNLSADPAQDYLGDIITEELTTALSQLRGSTVISSSSAFTLKGKPFDIKQLGSDLGVSYALEGSVLRSDGSVRINARLVDTKSAKTLWSDKFDVRRAERTVGPVLVLGGVLLGEDHEERRDEEDPCDHQLGGQWVIHAARPQLGVWCWRWCRPWVR